MTGECVGCVAGWRLVRTKSVGARRVFVVWMKETCMTASVVLLLCAGGVIKVCPCALGADVDRVRLCHPMEWIRWIGSGDLI